MTELPAVNHIISQENPESFDRIEWDLEMIGRHVTLILTLLTSVTVI